MKVVAARADAKPFTPRPFIYQPSSSSRYLSRTKSARVLLGQDRGYHPRSGLRPSAHGPSWTSCVRPRVRRLRGGPRAWYIPHALTRHVRSIRAGGPESGGCLACPLHMPPTPGLLASGTRQAGAAVQFAMSVRINRPADGRRIGANEAGSTICRYWTGCGSRRYMFARAAASQVHEPGALTMRHDRPGSADWHPAPGHE